MNHYYLNPVQDVENLTTYQFQVNCFRKQDDYLEW